MNKTTLNGEPYSFHFGLKANIQLEKTYGKSLFELDGSEDICKIYHCAFLAHNESFTIPLEEFIDILDINVEVEKQLSADFTAYMNELKKK